MGTRQNVGIHVRLVALCCLLSATGCVTLAEGQTQNGFNWLPSWPKIATQNPIAQPASAQTVATEARQVHFVVRFESEPALSEIGRNFRRDEQGSRQKFSAWKSQYACLQGVELVRASYSGELVLGVSENDPLGRTPAQVLAEIRELDNLVYAEADDHVFPDMETE